MDMNVETDNKTGKYNNKIHIENNKRKKRKNQNKSKQTKIATWNIRTMMKTGKMEEIAKEIEKYNIDITAVQEVRWSKQGEITRKGFVFLYSGEEKGGNNGVGFYVAKKLRNTIVDFKPVNHRIAVLRLKMKEKLITMVNIYAPTEVTEPMEKDQFYETLEKICEEIPRKDEIIILGDINAQLGKEQYLKNVIGNGKGTIHDITNDNGHRICQLAATLDMKCLSTKFEHPKKHKVTWRHPSGNTENQIDHILATRGISRKTTNTRTYRGANADSDHYMVMAKINNLEKKKIYKTSRETVRWNLEALADDKIKEKYEEEITKNIQIETTEVESHWKQLKSAIIRATQETIGQEKTQKSKNEWFDQDCEVARKQKNAARIKWINTRKEQDRRNYEIARNKANTLYKKKKNNWIDKTLEDIEKDRKNNNLKQFYKKIKIRHGKSQIKTRGLKDKNGTIAYESYEIGKIWTEYYSNALNIMEEEITERDLEDPILLEEEEISCPTEVEIQNEIRKARNGKAPGEDNITAELLKYGGEQLHLQIYQLIKQIWSQNKMPEEWNTGIIIPIYKKGNKEECENYRAITLLNYVYKILSNQINHKLKVNAEKIIGDYQNGFRPGRSTLNAIHTIEQIIQKTREHNREMHIIFIDFKSAFDTVKRRKMLEELEILGIPKKLRDLLEMCLTNTKAKVRFQGTTTESFSVNNGVKQGDSISPTLFNLILEGIIRRTNLNKDIITNRTQIIAYADDLTIITYSKKELGKAIEKLDLEARKFGLQINERKTKYMRIGKINEDMDRFLTTQNHQFERVDTYNYLGVTIGKTGKERIQERIIKGNQVYGINRTLFKSKKISKKTKINIYKTLIRPVITYGMETIVINKSEEECLNRLERKIMRSILGPNITAEGERRLKRNAEIEEELNGENIVRHIKALRLEWVGHIMRREPNEMIKKITKWIPIGQRTRGRPRKRWWDEIEDDIKAMKISNWRGKCTDRKIWKEITRTARTHNKL